MGHPTSNVGLVRYIGSASLHAAHGVACDVANLIAARACGRANEGRCPGHRTQSHSRPFGGQRQRLWDHSGVAHPGPERLRTPALQRELTGSACILGFAPLGPSVDQQPAVDQRLFMAHNTEVLDVHVLRMVILPNTCRRGNQAHGSVVGMFAGPCPVPGVLDFRAFEVTRL